MSAQVKSTFILLQVQQADFAAYLVEMDHAQNSFKQQRRIAFSVGLKKLSNTQKSGLCF